MQCPFCDSETTVKGTRIVDGGRKVVRHRKCENGHRFRTVETTGELLVKKDAGHVEPFDKAKIAGGVKMALYKRLKEEKVSPKAWEVAGEVEAELIEGLDERDSLEVDRRTIGRLVLSRLRDIDWLAWLRYSSVLWDERDAVSKSKRKETQERIDALLDEILVIPDP